MRLPTTFRWIAVTTCVLGVAGSATAQPGGAGGGAGGAANAQVGFEHQQNLSVQDEVSQTEQMIAHMDQSAGTVRRQLEAARAARDVVKTLCLNDKLSQIDVAARSARDRQASLQAAAQRNDGELAGHEFAIVTEHRRRADQLTAEANQCIGEEVAFVGQTQISVVIDPNLPTGGDMTAFPGSEVTPVPVIPPPPVSGNGG